MYIVFAYWAIIGLVLWWCLFFFMQVKNNVGSHLETVCKLHIRNLVHSLSLHEVQQEYLKNMFLLLFMFRKHLGHKPYVCKPCNKNFSQFKSLRLVAASKGQCHEKSMAF